MLIIALVLLVRWFVRFNTYRMSGYLAKSGLEQELNEHLAKVTKSELASISHVIDSIGRQVVSPVNPRIQRDRAHYKNIYQELQRMSKQYEM